MGAYVEEQGTLEMEGRTYSLEISGGENIGGSYPE